jgi:hypothetical protein
MLYYFASQDMMISHTLARRFFWNQCILFKDDVPPNMPILVSLSGQDLIVPTRNVWPYLTGKAVPEQEDAVWTNGRLRVRWFDSLDHAGLFAAKAQRRQIAAEVRNYCDRLRREG